MTEAMEIIHGPVAPQGGGVIYQITLPQGLVMTKPSDFEVPQPLAVQPARVVSHDGRLLTPDASGIA